MIDPPSKITRLANWRSARAAPILLACAWHEAATTAWLAHWRAAFVLQRNWIRLWRV